MTSADRDDHDIDDADLPLPACPRDAPVCVGYSGGMDSTVLLHALASLTQIRDCGLRALHVHHGLHADADAWAAHCATVCASLRVPLTVMHVSVADDPGLGREGAARQARYRAFGDALHAGDILALAHHRDDQAETVLLRALRGSGSDGLAAMRPWRAHDAGWLWRPMLAQPRAALRAYAERHKLTWIEDPTNADIAFDRSYLRERVLPLLRARWPQVGASLARVATLAAESAELLGDGDRDAQLTAATRDPQTLRADALQAMDPRRRARVLRRWIVGLGLPPLPAAGVARIASDLLTARPDADARFDWHGASVRRWRNLLHAGPLIAPLRADYRTHWDGCEPLSLPTGQWLRLEHSPDAPSTPQTRLPAAAYPATRIDPPLIVHARRGGERIRLAGRAHSHSLSNVLQQRAVPPWCRDVLPLLSDTDGILHAIGDVASSATFAQWLQARGLRLAHGPLP